jgi:ferritin-like protein
MTGCSLTLEALDVDGALEAEVAAVLPKATRAKLLRTSLGGIAAIVTGLATTSGATARPELARGAITTVDSKRDIAMLRFDLVLEYLQAGLYTEAERLGQLSPKTLAWSRVVGAHERAHAAAIRGLLGSHAVPSPSFDYRDVTAREEKFVKTAVAFEELTAALLKWQAPRFEARNLVAAIATLHSVETRHAAWIRKLIGLRPAAHAFDEPAPQQRMAELIASTRFITGKSRMSAHETPRYTG